MKRPLLPWVIAAIGALGGMPSPAGAVLERAGEHVHDRGAFRLFMTNFGVLGNQSYPSFSDLPSLEWPAGSANEYLNDTGLWIGARDRRGNVAGVSTAAPVSELRPALEAAAHIFESFDGAPGTRRLGTTQTVAEADDDADGDMDEEFLNGRDDDQDGRIDEDYVAIGEQTFACEYRDDTPEAAAQLLAHRPLHVAVRQLSFTWTEGIGALDRSAVVRYEIENTGDASLYDVYLGFYVDPDVGPKASANYWRDDRYSVETITGGFPTRGAAIVPGCGTIPYERIVAIVEDAPDGAGGAAGGDAPGLIAAFILDHTTQRWGFRAPEEIGTSAVVHLAGRAFRDATREDLADQEKYALMQSKQVMGDLRVDDHRFVLVAGPYAELPAGSSLALSVALVLARDRNELAATVSDLVSEFHGRWLNLDGNFATGRNGAEACLLPDEARFCGFTPFLVDHDCDELETPARAHGGCRNTVIQTRCPHLGLDAFCSGRLLILSSRCTYANFDCDPCTPANVGAETLVRWASTATHVSSQPLAKRVTPGDRAATIEWDNAAELPTAARVLPAVVGYRVWRSTGFTRAPGASGPTAGSWELVVELPLPGSDLPPPATPFIVEGVPVVDTVPGPGDSLYAHYAIGRYRFTDTEVQNGYAVFHDVTPFTLVEDGGVTVIESLAPRARSGDEVFPVEAAGGGGIRVVPNPYLAHAPWDLEPNRTDPSGRKILFSGLPAAPARIDIFTLAGDRVRTLEHDGQSGSAAWDLLSKNGQPVAPGIYLYHVEAPGLAERGKLVIVK